MKVLITGADGFIGKNLSVALGEERGTQVLPVGRTTSASDFESMVEACDAVVHLAGVNRPKDVQEFVAGNIDFTKLLAAALRETGRPIPVVFASSIQAERDNPYGFSKRAAEETLALYSHESGAAVAIYRLANVFGKWCRPNYNSVVATFCHNIARGHDIDVHDQASPLRLVYVDDVITSFKRELMNAKPGLSWPEAGPIYETTVGELAEQIKAFDKVRHTLISERVGKGLTRALYATYITYLEPHAFSYAVPKHEDPRGAFVEMLKTQDSGQFSFFTAYPGVTRGGHYHHTKTEKFLVISGKARFRFRHLVTHERYELETTGEAPTIVETIPGWSHDITNIGDGEMVVMLWANEIFDRTAPDTVAAPLW